MFKKRIIGSLCMFLTVIATAHAEWAPAGDRIMTEWGSNMSSDKPLPEYPRPQMRRADDSWTNLNGLWQYAIRPREEAEPAAWDGQILVPFAIESALSGVGERVGAENRLWYRCTFDAAPDGKNVLLHFGAVDWECEAWVNGISVGVHRGGYDPFTFDITSALGDGAQHELVVAVWDPSDQGEQPRGKQVVKPEGIWYTPVTGIWQTVWIETVPPKSIASLLIQPNIDSNSVAITVTGRGTSHDDKVEIRVKEGGEDRTAGGQVGAPIKIQLADPQLWSPDSPHLYDFEVLLADGKGVQQDAVQSYFGMRKIELKKDVAGVNRFFLNNEPLFQFGPLDQGWWPDGLYTAPTDDALRYDIAVTKEAGYNMIRKHVKVEPARWYYHCDQIGMLVWQDMPNGGPHIGHEHPDPERDPAHARQFERELKALIDTYYNHPAIVLWVIFNEGWGQYDTPRLTDWATAYDPSRLVISASGWADRDTGHAHDIHSYPGPAIPDREDDRAAVLGEYGGLGLVIENHLWLKDGNWGYRSYKDVAELQQNYEDLLDKLVPMITEGLAAAVYTQTTDVEIEVNGLMTYDRKVFKMNKEWLRNQNLRTYPAMISGGQR